MILKEYVETNSNVKNVLEKAIWFKRYHSFNFVNFLKIVTKWRENFYFQTFISFEPNDLFTSFLELNLSQHILLKSCISLVKMSN